MKQKLIALLALTLMLGSTATPAHAETMDQGVMVEVHTCLSSNVAGDIALQIMKSGTSTWKTVGTSKAYDETKSEDGACPKWGTGVFWTPNVVGKYSIRLYGLTTKQTYLSKSWTIVGSAPQVQYVYMPKMVGDTDGHAKNWLFVNGYKFGVFTKSTGFAPKISCTMSGRNVVVKQFPAPNTKVENSGATVVYLYVNCG